MTNKEYMEYIDYFKNTIKDNNRLIKIQRKKLKQLKDKKITIGVSIEQCMREIKAIQDRNENHRLVLKDIGENIKKYKLEIKKEK